MSKKNVFKNITPSVAIVVAGLAGAYLVYNTYFSDNVTAVQMSAFEPAAGETVATETTTAVVETTTTGSGATADAIVDTKVEKTEEVKEDGSTVTTETEVKTETEVETKAAE